MDHKSVFEIVVINGGRGGFVEVVIVFDDVAIIVVVAVE